MDMDCARRGIYNRKYGNSSKFLKNSTTFAPDMETCLQGLGRDRNVDLFCKNKTFVYFYAYRN